MAGKGNETAKDRLLRDTAIEHAGETMSLAQFEQLAKEKAKRENYQVRRVKTSDAGLGSSYTKQRLSQNKGLKDYIQRDRGSDMVHLQVPGGGAKKAPRHDASPDPQPVRRHVDFSLPDISPSQIAFLLLVVLLLSGAAFVMKQTRLFVGKATHYLSSAYDAEIFQYEGRDFFGNQQYDKPEGVCFRLDDPGYALGYFDGGKLDDYALLVQGGGTFLDMGDVKDGRLHGAGIRLNNGTGYAARFKKGQPTGYGLRCMDGREQIVRFRDGNVELIAERSGQDWLKPDGKKLKLRGDKYKGMHLTSPGVVSFGKDNYCAIDLNGERASFDQGDLSISWSPNRCWYDGTTYKEGRYKGTEITYIMDTGKLEGSHYFKDSHSEFSANVGPVG